MNPKTPQPDGHGLEATAMSSQGGGTVAEQTDRTELGTGVTGDTSSPTDQTMVRPTPSAATVNDLSDPNSFGKYELLGEIARGGMGVVYRARQHGLDRLVALKMILGTGDHETALRFLQEARAAAALDHPNVVPIYDTGEIGNRPYFTMALIEGPNLRGFVEAGGQLPIGTVVSLFAQIVAGVAHAHRHGIIHRDLKPANVLIDKDGRPRVTDFGLAKRAAVDSQLTATGQVVGTPSYMAPEQARDSKDVGPPADVYALGAILYFLLTGRAPFTADNLTDLLIKVVSEPPVPPRHERPDVPEELEALCLRCLAKAPADRFDNAEALAAALAPVAERYFTPSGSATPILGVAFPRIPPSPSAATVPDVAANSGPALSNSLSTTLPPESRANRTPVLVGLGALALVLVAVVVFLATRDKKGEVVNNDPPPVNPTPTPAPNPSRGPAPIVNAKGGDKVAWPAPARADFGLTATLVAPAAKKDEDGLPLFPPNTALEVHVTAEKDCRVSVWILDATGEMLLLPNDSETDDRLLAGQKRVIPGKGAKAFVTTPTVGNVDRLRILATTGDKPVFPEGIKQSEYTVYVNKGDRERLASTIRGIALKRPDEPGSHGEVSEVELRFRVSK